MNDGKAPVVGGIGLHEISESLCTASDMLQGVDLLLAGEGTPALRRSARALLSLAADMVAQSCELARAMRG